MTLGVVDGDGVGDLLEEDGLARPRRRDEQASLSLTDRRDQIEDALSEAKDLLVRAADSAEATKAEVREAATIAKEAATKAQDAKALFDAAIAARARHR